MVGVNLAARPLAEYSAVQIGAPSFSEVSFFVSETSWTCENDQKAKRRSSFNLFVFLFIQVTENLDKQVCSLFTFNPSFFCKKYFKRFK